MKSYGHINMLDNELQQVVIGVEANFPAVAVPGRFVFKNKIMYICAEVVAGVPAWIPMTQQISTHIHYQTSNSATWTIDHNLNSATPVVQCYGPDQKLFIPNDVTVISNNQVVITTANATVGRAVVLQPSLEGNTKPNYSYEHLQTIVSSTWVIPHGLGYMPVVRIFIGQVETIPQSIVHDSNFQVTVTFSTPQVGTALLV